MTTWKVLSSEVMLLIIITTAMVFYVREERKNVFVFVTWKKNLNNSKQSYQMSRLFSTSKRSFSKTNSLVKSSYLKTSYCIPSFFRCQFIFAVGIQSAKIKRRGNKQVERRLDLKKIVNREKINDRKNNLVYSNFL